MHEAAEKLQGRRTDSEGNDAASSWNAPFRDVERELGPNAHTLPNCTPCTRPRTYLYCTLGLKNTLWQPGPEGAMHAPTAPAVMADTSAFALYTQGDGHCSTPPPDVMDVNGVYVTPDRDSQQRNHTGRQQHATEHIEHDVADLHKCSGSDERADEA